MKYHHDSSSVLGCVMNFLWLYVVPVVVVSIVTVLLALGLGIFP